jgi:hypothetical protein
MRNKSPKHLAVLDMGGEAKVSRQPILRDWPAGVTPNTSLLGLEMPRTSPRMGVAFAFAKLRGQQWQIYR